MQAERIAAFSQALCNLPLPRETCEEKSFDLRTVDFEPVFCRFSPSGLYCLASVTGSVAEWSKALV